MPNHAIFYVSFVNKTYQQFIYIIDIGEIIMVGKQMESKSCDTCK